MQDLIPQEAIKLEDLVEGGAVSGPDVLIEDLSTGNTAKGKTYYTIKVRSKGPTVVECKIWDEATWLPHLKIGSVCKIWGRTGSYNGKIQITIDRVMDSQKNPTDFQKTSSQDLTKIWDEMVKIVDTFEEPFAKFLAEELLTDEALAPRYRKAPAAKGVHNAWIGGLLEHAHAMCVLAEGVIPQYRKYCPGLSRDKILLGCIIHDMGKIWEYDYESSPVIQMSEQGILVGHMMLGVMWVNRMFTTYWSRNAKEGVERAKLVAERDEVVHMIGSHHGKYEYGSPVLPATLEALILHNLDMMDSQIMHAIESMQKPGKIEGFGERSWIHGSQYKIIV